MASNTRRRESHRGNTGRLEGVLSMRVAKTLWSNMGGLRS